MEPAGSNPAFEEALHEAVAGEELAPAGDMDDEMGEEVELDDMEEYIVDDDVPPDFSGMDTGT